MTKKYSDKKEKGGPIAGISEEAMGKFLEDQEEKNNSGSFRLYMGSSFKNLYTAKDEDLIMGISSKINGKHIILLEWDQTNLEKVEETVRKIVDRYDSLADFYIMRSSKGCYHAISFSPVDFKTYVKIMRMAGVDPKFINFAKVHQEATLRISKKWYKKTSTINPIKVIEGQGEEDTETKNQYFQLVKLEKREKPEKGQKTIGEFE